MKNLYAKTLLKKNSAKVFESEMTQILELKALTSKEFPYERFF